MNKKIIISLSIVLLSIFLGGCTSNQLDVADITNIQIETTELINYGTSLNSISDNPTELIPIIELINQTLLANTKKHHSYNNDLQVDIGFSDNTVRSFNIDFDTINNLVYLKEEDTSYILEGEISEMFYSSNFYSNYIALSYEAPELVINANDISIEFTSIGEYTFNSYNNTKSNLVINDNSQTELAAINSNNNNLRLDFSVNPTSIVENLYVDNELLDSYQITNNEMVLPLDEGNYHIELLCNWDIKENQFFEGTVTYSFDMFYDLPAEFSLSKSSGNPGELIFITAENITDEQKIVVDAPFYKNSIYFYQVNNQYLGVLPVDGALSAAEHTITISTKEPSTNEEIIKELPFTVLNRDYPIQNLKVSSSTSALTNDSAQIALDREKVASVRSVESSAQELLYTDDFINPADGIITTEYYHIRYTNNNPTPRRHYGVDIANALGTPIMATNSGVVVLSEALVLTGNTVIVDHGCGLFSSYAHLDEMAVAVGDTIENGQVVGLMGSSGYSTGSHLHFEMYYDGNYVDPYAFIDHNPYMNTTNIDLETY